VPPVAAAIAALHQGLNDDEGDAHLFVWAGRTLLSGHWSHAFSHSVVQAGPLQLALFGSLGRSSGALALVLGPATALLVIAAVPSARLRSAPWWPERPPRRCSCRSCSAVTSTCSRCSGRFTRRRRSRSSSQPALRTAGRCGSLGMFAVGAGVAVARLLRDSPHGLWAAPLATVCARLLLDPLLLTYYFAALKGPLFVGAGVVISSLW
jgi:hypothetical protein